MRRFWYFVKKEFIHIFRDKRTLLILFGLPIALILIFGYVVTTDIKDAKIAIYDPSRDVRSTALINKILSSGYFVLEEYLEDINQVERVFESGKVKEVIVFDDDFAKKLDGEGSAGIQIIADASDANTANLLINYTRGIIISYLQEINQETISQGAINVEVRMVFNSELKGVYMFVPGTMALILMLVSAMMTSISIAREKELGTMEVLLVSPLVPLQIILGKVTPYFVLSFINAITIILMGYYIFDLPVQGSVVLLVAESMLFIMMALSLGILISTIAKTQQVAMFISMFALLLPSMLLSGFIFPIENMPWPLQYISAAMPPRWFIIIIKNIMIKGTGLAYVWKETLIISGMMLFFIGMSVRKFKIRLA